VGSWLGCWLRFFFVWVVGGGRWWRFFGTVVCGFFFLFLGVVVLFFFWLGWWRVWGVGICGVMVWSEVFLFCLVVVWCWGGSLFLLWVVASGSVVGLLVVWGGLLGGV